MKLCRIETPDGIKPAMIDADGAARDLTQHLHMQRGQELERITRLHERIPRQSFTHTVML